MLNRMKGVSSTAVFRAVCFLQNNQGFDAGYQIDALWLNYQATSLFYVYRNFSNELLPLSFKSTP